MVSEPGFLDQAPQRRCLSWCSPRRRTRIHAGRRWSLLSVEMSQGRFAAPACSAVSEMTEIPCLLANSIVSSVSMTMVFAASIAKQVARARIIVSIVLRPIVGTSNRMSCLGLATLTTVNPPEGQSLSGSLDRFVCSFDRFKSEDGPLADGDTLADIEST